MKQICTLWFGLTRQKARLPLPRAKKSHWSWGINRFFV